MAELTDADVAAACEKTRGEMVDRENAAMDGAVVPHAAPPRSPPRALVYRCRAVMRAQTTVARARVHSAPAALRQLEQAAITRINDDLSSQRDAVSAALRPCVPR